MHETMNYFANEMTSRDDVDDELYSSIDECELRMNFKTTNVERRALRDAYYENYDVDAMIKRNNESRASQKFDYVYSRMHAQSFVILNAYDMRDTYDNNKRAYARGDMF